MRFFSSLAYLFTIGLIYLSIFFTGKPIVEKWVREELMDFINTNLIVFFIAGFVLLLVNFKVSEILTAVKDALSGSTFAYERLIFDKKVLDTAWKYTLFISILVIFQNVYLVFINAGDTSKLGPFLALLLLSPLYAFSLKFFIFMPLTTSINKKINLLENK